MVNQSSRIKVELKKVKELKVEEKGGAGIGGKGGVLK